MEEITAQPEAVQELAQPEAKEQEASQPIADVEKTKTEASQPEFKVKYNKEEKVFSSWDEARPFVEKGMNYDHVKTELEEKRKALGQYENHRGLKFIEERAKRAGKTVDDFIDRLEAQETKKPVEIVRSERIAAEAVRQKEQAETKLTEREKQDAADKAFADEMKEFLKTHPTVTTLPDGVKEDIAKGIPIGSAYEKFELKERIRELEEKTKVQETNKTNADASMGALGAGPSKQGKLTLEDLDKMSPSEIDKRWKDPAQRAEIRALYGFKD